MDTLLLESYPIAQHVVLRGCCYCYHESDVTKLRAAAAITGMILILHSPGLMMPGQLGPMQTCSFACAPLLTASLTFCWPHPVQLLTALVCTVVLLPWLLLLLS
jgi:hypothetical protein